MWEDSGSRGVAWQTTRVEALRVCYRACLEYQAFDAEQAGGVYKKRRRSLVIMMWPKVLGRREAFASDCHRQMSVSENSHRCISVEMHDSRVGGLHVLRYFSDIVVAVCGNRNRSVKQTRFAARKSVLRSLRLAFRAGNFLLAVGTRRRNRTILEQPGHSQFLEPANLASRVRYLL